MREPHRCCVRSTIHQGDVVTNDAINEHRGETLQWLGYHQSESDLVVRGSKAWAEVVTGADGCITYDDGYLCCTRQTTRQQGVMVQNTYEQQLLTVHAGKLTNENRAAIRGW